MIQPSNN